MKTAIYARLSTDRSGLSENCQIQTAECRDYITDHGYTEILALSENDVSASKFSKKPRPKYGQLLDAIKRNEVQVVLVTEMPRLYRRMEELLELIRLAEATALRRIETTEGIVYDISTPEGIYAAINAVNNSILEAARTSKRVRRKKAARASQGKANGGRRVYGFEPDNETLRMEEIANLKEAGERWIAGESLSAVIRDFNKRKIPTTTGGLWRIQNLRRTLLNKRYLGIREHNGAEYKAVWESVFTAEQHSLMTSLAESNKWTTLTARKYLLTGFTYCQCGTLMVGSAKKYKSGNIRRYRCRSSNDMGRKPGCGRNIILADPTEEWVREAVFYRFDSPQTAAILAPAQTQSQIAELLQEFQERKAHLDSLVIDYGRKLFTREQFALAKQAAEAELEVTKTQLSKLQDDRAVGLLPVDQTIREAWDGASFEWRQAVIKLVIERIDIIPAEERRGRGAYKGNEFNPDLLSVTWRA